MLNIIIPSIVVGSFFVFSKHYPNLKEPDINSKNQQVINNIIRWKTYRDERIHREIADGISNAIKTNNLNTRVKINSYVETISNNPTDQWYFNPNDPNIQQVITQYKKSFDKINFVGQDYSYNNEYYIHMKDKTTLEIKLSD